MLMPHSPPWRLPALVALVLVVAMLGTFVATGIGQDPLQYVRPPTEYAQLLLRGGGILRAVIGLDNLFVLAYSIVFLGLGAALWRRGEQRALVLAATLFLMATAVLDLVENLHFLVLASEAQLGLVPSADRIALQAWESLVKFHLSYLGLLCLGLALPAETQPQRALKALLVGFQGPVGVAIYVVPQALALPLVLVRFGFFVASLALVSVIRVGPDASGSGARA